MNKKNYYRFLFFILFATGLVSATTPFLDCIGNMLIQTRLEFHTKKDLLTLKKELLKFKKSRGIFPADHRFTIWYKKYIKNSLYYNFPLDRWGEALIYETFDNKDSFSVKSKGIDKTLDTKDDIVIFSKKKIRKKIQNNGL